MSQQKKSTRRKERRRATRADARLSMRVEGAPSEDAQAQILTETQNISSSGVYCHSPHYLAPLSKVALTIVLPGMPGKNGARRLLKCEGIVVRCMAADRPTTRGTSARGGYQLACSFISLGDPTRRLLDDYVSWRNLQEMVGTAPAARRAAAAPRARARRTAGNGLDRPVRAAKRTTRRATLRRAAARRRSSS
jgi:hypothetical protein